MEGDQLRRERLGRGDANLRAGVRIDRAVGFARGHAADHVADGDAARALAARLAQRGQRVRGLTRLGDDDRKLLPGHDRIAVPVFGSVIDFNGHAGERLDQILSDEPGVPRCAALVGDVQLFQKNPASIQRHAPQNGVAGGGRLLVDLLEHEVLVPAFFRGDRIPHHALGGLGHRAAAVVRKRDT